MPEALRVITVPDFEGPQRNAFVTRTLYFLAFWVDLRLRERHGVHLACIGRPPSIVRRMAERASASVSVHAPVGLGRSRHANKLRGLQVAGRDEPVLLVDTDTWVLEPVDELAERAGDLALPPAIKARLPAEQWRQLARDLGLSVPTERFSSLRSRLERGHRALHGFEGQEKEGPAMVPYYNSGVLLTRHPDLVRVEWGRAMREIVDRRSDVHPYSAALTKSDQAALAIAVWRLQRQGQDVRLLPDAYHRTYLHLSAGVSLPSSKVFHALGFPGRRIGSPERAPAQFARDLALRLRREAWLAVRGGSDVREELNRWRRARREGRSLARRLDRLRTDVVGPLLPIQGDER